MLNRVCIMGRLVEDVELRTVGADGDISVGSFRIAVDRDYVDKKTGERPADFFGVTVWRGLAEFTARNFRKGDLAVVDGRLELRRWKDQEGNKHQTVGIKADDVYFGRKKLQPEDTEPWANGDPNELLPPPEGWGEPEMPPDNDNLPF